MTDDVAGGGATDPVRILHVDDGFYVADDSPGIQSDERDGVLDASYSADDEDTGFELRIIERVAEAHGWTVGVIESAHGGTRFEIMGIAFDE